MSHASSTFGPGAPHVSLDARVKVLSSFNVKVLSHSANCLEQRKSVMHYNTTTAIGHCCSLPLALCAAMHASIDVWDIWESQRMWRCHPRTAGAPLLHDTFASPCHRSWLPRLSHCFSRTSVEWCHSRSQSQHGLLTGNILSGLEAANGSSS